MFFITKQLRAERVKRFDKKFKELAQVCDFGKKKERLITDIFMPNLINAENQKRIANRDTRSQKISWTSSQHGTGFENSKPNPNSF